MSNSCSINQKIVFLHYHNNNKYSYGLQSKYKRERG